jgi:hypothetical protein
VLLGEFSMRETAFSTSLSSRSKKKSLIKIFSFTFFSSKKARTTLQAEKSGKKSKKQTILIAGLEAETISFSFGGIIVDLLAFLLISY